MSFKRLSIVTVFILVALFLAGKVLAAVVASLTIQDQQIDLSVPNASVNITLSGDPNEAKTFNIPITITYDDGTTRNIGYTFNYQPPSSVTPSPSPQGTCQYSEDPQNCPYGGARGCTGTWQDGVCKYDPAVDPNCWESCTPGPSSSCSSGIDCSDGNACTNDSCVNGQCEYSNKSEGEVCLRDPGTYEPTKTCDAYGSCSQSIGGSEPPPPPPPPPPSCDEDVYYCDNGTTIHKYGGYWDGSACQYAFDPGDPC